MTTTIREFCELLQNCASKFMEEIENSFKTCRTNVMLNTFTDTKLAIEKAIDSHNKEIILLLSGIITNIKVIVEHESKIRDLRNRQKLSEAELKSLSYVQKQIDAFSGRDQVVRRERRKTASELSVYCLETWDAFLKNEETIKSALITSTSLPNINIVPKRTKSKRHHKKLVSVTFDNILEDEEGRCNPMEALSEEPSHDFNELIEDFYKSDSSCDINICADEIGTEEEVISTEIEVNKELQQKNENDTESQTKNDWNTDCDHDTHLELPLPIIQMDDYTGQEVDTKPKIVGFLVSFIYLLTNFEQFLKQ